MIQHCLLDSTGIHPHLHVWNLCDVQRAAGDDEDDSFDSVSRAAFLGDHLRPHVFERVFQVARSARQGRERLRSGEDVAGRLGLTQPIVDAQANLAVAQNAHAHKVGMDVERADELRDEVLGLVQR